MDLSNDHKVKRVVFVIYPGVTLLDVTGPLQAFSSANNTEIVNGNRIYDVAIASPDGGPVVTDCLVELGSVSLDQAATRAIDTLIIAGGQGVFDAVEQKDLVEWIRSESAKCRRVASTCMGSFLTAEAGLLEGQSARHTGVRWKSYKGVFPKLTLNATRFLSATAICGLQQV